jgi:hypothetical protein
VIHGCGYVLSVLGSKLDEKYIHQLCFHIITSEEEEEEEKESSRVKL